MISVEEPIELRAITARWHEIVPRSGTSVAHDVGRHPGRVGLELVARSGAIGELAEPLLDEHLREHGVAGAQIRSLGGRCGTDSDVVGERVADRLLDRGSAFAVVDERVTVGVDADPPPHQQSLRGDLGPADHAVGDHPTDAHRRPAGKR